MPIISKKGKFTLQEIQVRMSNMDLRNFAIQEAKVDPNKVYEFSKFDLEFNDDDSVTVTLKIKEEIPGTLSPKNLGRECPNCGSEYHTCC